MNYDPDDPRLRKALSDALVRAARRLSEQGLSPGGSGNLSVRCGDIALVTPSGSALGRLASEDLVALRIEDGTALEDHLRPTKEAPIHLGLLRAAPEVGAIVHLHSPWASAISCLPARDGDRADLPPHTPYQVMRFGDLQVAPYAAPGTEELAGGVLRKLRGAGAILMSHHGLVTAHASVEGAADIAEELESAAHVAFLLTGREGTQLQESDVADLR